MKRLEELKRTDHDILEEIHQSLLSTVPELQRALEILAEDNRRHKIGLDIPDIPDNSYGKQL